VSSRSLDAAVARTTANMAAVDASRAWSEPYVDSGLYPITSPIDGVMGAARKLRLVPPGDRRNSTVLTTLYQPTTIAT